MFLEMFTLLEPDESFVGVLSMVKMTNDVAILADSGKFATTETLRD